MVRVALLYGSVCFLVLWSISVVGWWLFPNRAQEDELMHQIRWAGHVLGEKVFGLLLLSVTAFLASRAYHPTWKWGLATGITSAVAFELIGAVVYIARFGVGAYQQCNLFSYNMLWTVLAAWLFSYLAVRKQCSHEKQAA
jgi:hypothetical protein